MGRTVKARRRKQYMYNVNRKKLQQKRKQKLLPRIPCEAIRENWDDKKHTKANLEAMGLVYKVNDVLPASSHEETFSISPATEPHLKQKQIKKPEVIEKLKEQANRPRERQVRLPREQVRFVEYMQDKYDQDYVKMARDARNHFQLTPKQIRRLVYRFWDIPEHFTPYMKRKGMLEKPEVGEVDVE